MGGEPIDAGDVKEGLEGVKFTRTKLSLVDGEAGRLVIGGRDVEALAGEQHGFEHIVALLLDGTAPDAGRTAEVRKALASARVSAFESQKRWDVALAASDPMDALRGALAVSGVDPSHLAVIGAVPVMVAAWSRRHEKQPLVEPDPSLAHGADYLRMVRGSAPTDALASGLDAYLVTVSDHGMNASTFAARVVASTASDLVSSIVAAVGALKGPLHGGAPGPVLDMLDAIGSPERAVPWLEGELAARRRIMGMGHRVYRVRDPRAAVLERAVLDLEKAGISTGRLALARAVEQAATGILRGRYPDRPLHANVEFYTAVLLDTLGLPRTLFTPTFAVGRVAGWCAHVAEQRATGRLIRPDALYVGPLP